MAAWRSESSERTREAAEILGEQIVYAIRQAEPVSCGRLLTASSAAMKSLSMPGKSSPCHVVQFGQSSFDGVGPGIK
jgi:hypothetical protein